NYMMASTENNQSQAFGVENKGKRKLRVCDFESKDDVECDYELNGVHVVTEKITIPDSSEHLDLVNK
ncbi:15682_t:CDS:1, partial [Racocetra persica]